MNYNNLLPARGCLLKFGQGISPQGCLNENCNINSINECCFNTCAQFIDNNYVMDSECGKKCIKTMYDLIRLNKKQPCEYWPERPVIKERPKFFKQALEKGMDKEKARICCYRKCNNVVNKNECKEYCDFAYQAMDDMNDIKENFEEKKNNNCIIYPLLFLIFFVILFFIITNNK